MMKGQVVIEFLMLVCIAVLLGVVYLSVGNELLRDTSEQQRLEALNNVGYMIQDEVILATTVEDGYRRSFIIPSSADRFLYSLSNDETSVTLMSGSIIMTYDLPEINGTFVQGTNLIKKTGMVQVN